MKHWWKQGLVLALFGLLLGLLWLRLPRTYDLILLAKQVPGTRGKIVVDYFWISNSRILTFQALPSGDIEAFSIDPATGKPTAIPALNAVKSSDNQVFCSPDGEWLLVKKQVAWGKELEEGGMQFGADVIRVVKADGSCLRTHKIANYADLEAIGWMPDSRHYMFSFWKGDFWLVQIHDVNNAHLVRTIVAYDSQSKFANYEDNIFGRSQFLTTSDQHVLLAGPDTRNGGNAPTEETLFDINLRSNPAHIQRITFPLPQGAKFSFEPGEVALSPDGKRIAWNFHFNDRLVRYPSFWKQFWNVRIQHKARLLPEYIPTQEIWVSRSDGSHMHQIAYQPDMGSISTLVVNMKWRPDSKALSFSYVGEGIEAKDGSLYSILAD